MGSGRRHCGRTSCHVLRQEFPRLGRRSEYRQLTGEPSKSCIRSVPPLRLAGHRNGVGTPRWHRPQRRCQRPSVQRRQCGDRADHYYYRWVLISSNSCPVRGVAHLTERDQMRATWGRARTATSINAWTPFCHNAATTSSRSARYWLDERKFERHEADDSWG
jgi:hypothetical protein